MLYLYRAIIPHSLSTETLWGLQETMVSHWYENVVWRRRQIGAPFNALPTEPRRHIAVLVTRWLFTSSSDDLRRLISSYRIVCHLYGPPLCIHHLQPRFHSPKTLVIRYQIDSNKQGNVRSRQKQIQNLTYSVLPSWKLRKSKQKNCGQALFRIVNVR